MKAIKNLRYADYKKMKRIFLLPALLVIVLSSCNKEELTLSGSSSVSGFEYQISRSPGGDTLPFSSKVVFTNSSSDAFAWLWDFGDATQSVLENPQHVYETGTSFLVSLTSIGKAGNNKSTKTISLESPCEFSAFSLLSGCGNKKWGLSPENDAIRIVNGTDTISSTPPAACQGDDVYTFSSTGSFSYDAKGQTFVNGSCQSPKQNAASYIMLKNEGGFPKLVLGSVTDGNPFLGRTDEVNGNSYEILSITEDAFRLRSVLGDGRQVITKFISASLSPAAVKLFLSGGSRKTWRLDSLSSAPITAGVEANPTQYFSGGPLAPCQKDDWYTFTTGDSLYVNCNGSTLQPSQGYSCGDDESFGSTYGFGPVSGAAVGLAQISLSPNNPAQWIGVLDRSGENVYRILEISSNAMTLRAGNGSGLVHTLKFVSK